MKITELTLTNFRSFKQPQRIEFSPVTLLFGPNSVGKSSVLLSLFYLQHMLKEGECDPVRIEAMGNKYVGGFKSLVNSRDLRNPIRIKIGLDLSRAIPNGYFELPSAIDDDLGFEIESPIADADSLAIEFEIAWSESMRTAFVASYRVWLDEEPVVQVTSNTGMRDARVEWVNFYHPLLGAQAEWGEQDLYTPCSRFHEVLEEGGYWQRYDDADLETSEDEPSAITEVLAVSYKGWLGALPVLGTRLRTNINKPTPLLALRVEEILSDLIVAPLDNLLKFLDQSLAIGPLRTVPDSTYKPDPYPKQADWYDGAAAWSMVSLDSFDKFDEINHWLTSETGLGLGYSLRRKVEMGRVLYARGDDGDNDWANIFATARKVGISLEFHNVVPKDYEVVHGSTGEPVSEKELATLGEIVVEDMLQQSNIEDQELFVKHSAVLWDTVNKIEVSSSDIGVGVSQLFPLVVAALTAKGGLVACEQPELHVHPRVQVGIGDLLSQVNECTYLVETHSEHLILRLLKRIRQTTDDELPEGFQPVLPQQVSIVYLESSPNGVVARRIAIDEDGEFRDRWPDGFFTERREELM